MNLNKLRWDIWGGMSVFYIHKKDFFGEIVLKRTDARHEVSHRQRPGIISENIHSGAL